MQVKFIESDILIMAKKDNRLIIYEKMINLIYYSKNLLLKYPKSEKYDLCVDIKRTEFVILKNILYAWKEFDNNKKRVYLRQVDVDLMVLKALIRLSHMSKYITDKNLMVWSEKIEEIGRLIGAWLKACQKG